MSDLEMETHVWPTPNHTKLMGNKLELIMNLDWVAKKLGSPRPKTVRLRRGDTIPRNVVLKRTHSDQQSHVILPGTRRRGWAGLDEGPDGAQWFAQDYVGLLRKVGEWRVFMVGGNITYVVHTAYLPERECWMYTNVNVFLSLCKLR